MLKLSDFLKIKITIPLFTVLILLVATCSAQTKNLPRQVFGKNLNDCVNKLKSQVGGWCEIRLPGKYPSISSVWPVNLDRRTRMITGPSSVLTAWNGAAFDEENRIFYFMGGGHADYGGNEVYEFRLDNGKWRRLTDPSPLKHLFLLNPGSKSGEKKYCWAQNVDAVPSAAHTYDGIQFSRLTKTVFVVIHGAANGSCFVDKKDEIDADSDILLTDKNRTRAIYEFNPSTSDTKHGLKPLEWRRLINPFEFAYPRSVELADGQMLVGASNTLFKFNPVTGKTGQRVILEADYGDGLAKYHPNGSLLLVSRWTLRIRKLPSGKGQVYNMPQTNGKSLAIDSDGLIVSWNGRNQILTFDPNETSPQWALYDWKESGPQLGQGSVYSKWQYIKRDDVFVGISNHKTGVWVYKHPKDIEGSKFSNTDLQKIINNAKAGSTVTLPPGTYGRGLAINKSLTVSMKGVNLLGIARNKAIISVNCDDCDVTIEDFKTKANTAGCVYGNCAAIKGEGKNFRLTVKRAHIDNPVMGIITDNRDGILRIEDTIIENTGLNDLSATLAHGVYAGQISEVHIKNSTIRNVQGNGHIFKSRARTTILENVKLLGENGFHSRTIDLPCGGNFVLTDSFLQHGANTDNSDLISVGTEQNYCKSIEPTNVRITNNTIIIDRDHSSDERARDYGPNAFFNWQGPLGKLDIRDNKIVNLESWSYAGGKKNIKIPDQSSKNTMCKTRKDCGL